MREEKIHFFKFYQLTVHCYSVLHAEREFGVRLTVGKKFIKTFSFATFFNTTKKNEKTNEERTIF